MRQYAAMLPRLRAEEAVQHAEVVAVGSGTLKEDAARAITDRWRHESGAPRRKAPPMPKAMRKALFGR